MSVVLNSRQDYVNNITTYTKTKTGGVTATGGSKRYYSQVDAELYIGETYIDDIAGFHFQVQQNAMPLYGYNSYTVDQYAVGTRIINGVFVINFTSPGYLNKVLEAVKSGSTANRLDAANWRTPFTIDIAFGVTNQVHCILENVVLTGLSMQLGVSGEPITETYSFIASNMTTTG